MIGMAERGPHTLNASTSARLASVFLLALLAAGCLVLWIGIPVVCMWAAAKLTEDAAQHFLIVLPTVLVAMTVWARALFWLNRLYLRVRLGAGMLDPDEDAPEDVRWARGPLEPMLIATLVVALILLFAWFFVLAENPSRRVI